MKLFNVQDPFHSIRSDLRRELHTTSRPTDDWLFSTGGRPHDERTDPLAQQVADSYRPQQKTTPQAMRPGWAGLASYRLPYADGDKHLKVAMVRPRGEESKYTQLCAEAMGEATRAAWAGANGLGPRVHFTHAQLGAFITDFIDGRMPDFEESRGPLLHAHLHALAALHRKDPSTVPGGGQTNWLLEMRADEQLASSTQPRSHAVQHAYLQVEAGLEQYLGRQSVQGAPIHDDYKPDNTLFSNGRIVMLDWNNLRVAAPEIDLGHFAVMEDFTAASISSRIVTPYTNIQQSAGHRSASPPALLTLTRTYASLFRLKNSVFYDQWEGTRPKAEWTRLQLVGDIEVLRDTVFRELGLRPHATFKPLDS